MLRTGPLTLAEYSDFFGWGLGWWVGCLALLALAAGGVVLVGRLRRWLREPDEPLATGFSLGALRKLKQEGKLTDEEFQKAAALITKTHVQAPIAKPVATAPKKKPSAQDRP